ncbi:MAG: hypothetical protein M1817_005787 [Caeruleum heppii]|nr:MAG: hypothetical protein M1817_005787 [Caeruleum heppii]
MSVISRALDFKPSVASYLGPLSALMALDPPSPPSTPPSKSDNRRASCMHATMTRLYGDYKCCICHQYSSLGWVYSCTQDRDFAVYEGIDFTNHAVNRSTNHIKGDANGDHDLLGHTSIAPATVRNDKQPGYTQEQLETLRAQREKVAEVLAALSIVTDKVGDGNDVQSAEYSSDGDTTDSASSMEDKPSPHTPPKPSLLDRVLRRPSTPLVPPSVGQCYWKCCHRCRPGSLDRSWVSLNAILAGQPNPSVEFEFHPRPISHLSHVLNLGLRKPPPRWYEMDYWASDSSESGLRTLDDMSDARGLRASIKHAFRGMWMGGRRQRRDSTSSTDESVRHRQLPTLDEDAEDFDLGLWARENDELLAEASSVQLPEEGEGDKKNGEGEAFDGGPVTVEGGIAVTEEGVEERVADVLTQA